jgi:hypothetical protein
MAVTMKMAVLWVVAPCGLYEFTDVSEVCTACIVRADDGGSTHLWNVVNFYETIRRNTPEENHIPTRRRENLKSRQTRSIALATTQFVAVSPTRFSTACDQQHDRK